MDQSISPGHGSEQAPASAGFDTPHESAIEHVSGSARYIDDIPEVGRTLHAAPVLSPVAHGRLNGFHKRAYSQLLARPEICALIQVSDIPGDLYFSTPAHDEPILALDHVHHIGQVIALVVATSHIEARVGAALAQAALDIDELPAVLTIDAAVNAKAWVLDPVTLQRGDPDRQMAKAAHRLSGQFTIGGQEHFYLEGQIAYALPQENDAWLVHSSTQHPGEVQHWIAHCLKRPANAVDVVCRRMGGGFGGKETQAGHLAVWAALAAHVSQCAVKMRLDRDDDFLITGKRHGMRMQYDVGFNGQGEIDALFLTAAANCGFSADLSGPVNDRTIFHADNAYYLPAVRIDSLRCRTNTQSNTAFRGFGGPQGVLAIEVIIGNIASHLVLDPLRVRMSNIYRQAPCNVTPYGMEVEDNILEPLMSRLADSANYAERREQISNWNRNNSVLKKGLALTPVKFGISFTATQFNQAGALVNVYTDGSVQVNHGGTEMGQGLHTKVCQIVADELGVSFEQVRISASDTSKVPNASATAASSGTDLNARAAQFAAREVRQRLQTFIADSTGCTATEVLISQSMVTTPGEQQSLVHWLGKAYSARIQLFSDGFYATPKIHYDKKTLSGRPFYYFSYGAAVSEVAIDTLTGEIRVLAVDILHDVGRSINPAIDVGQVEGGFIQGMGWLTSEELVWDGKGLLRTHSPSTYKIPTVHDLPPRWQVDLWQEPNPEDNVFGSKAVGEPPLMLAISVFEAIADAVRAGHAGAAQLNAPATAESILTALSGGSLDAANDESH